MYFIHYAFPVDSKMQTAISLFGSPSVSKPYCQWPCWLRTWPAPYPLSIKSAQIRPCQPSQWPGCVQLALLRKYISFCSSQDLAKETGIWHWLVQVSFSGGFRVKCLNCILFPFGERTTEVETWRPLRQTDFGKLFIFLHLILFMLKWRKCHSPHNVAAQCHDTRL